MNLRLSWLVEQHPSSHKPHDHLLMNSSICKNYLETHSWICHTDQKHLISESANLTLYNCWIYIYGMYIHIIHLITIYFYISIICLKQTLVLVDRTWVMGASKNVKYPSWRKQMYEQREVCKEQDCRRSEAVLKKLPHSTDSECYHAICKLFAIWQLRDMLLPSELILLINVQCLYCRSIKNKTFFEEFLNDLDLVSSMTHKHDWWRLPNTMYGRYRPGTD